jgi:cyclic beta-1,2-glucan synthetase
LKRDLTNANAEPALLSWNGSMLEYLMPLLMMPNYEQTLLSRTYQSVVKTTIDYCAQRGVPWGISASFYNSLDDNQNYRYAAFGVPGLGLKPGLADELVIAPHATALALMVAPQAALQNLERLFSQGFIGNYGFYEAIDYTPGRVPIGQNHVIIQSFMAHHQGMTLLSLSKVLLESPMQELFELDRNFQAILPLLQEAV